ncbi:MAG TPA: NADH-quinone oxidoreductase subunit M, partial [Cytophagales bacterium]|nr:NADH-quinone oxidoreductase subunit M [Cytophagales bacterium]
GVDGISVAMILLTAIVIFTGVFISWQIEYLTKEFFVLFIFLSSGVYGFFISLDLFTMFLFYEFEVIPMYLLIGMWGSGRKEYGAMKLTLMIMAGSALLIVGLLGIYFNSGLTFDLTQITKSQLPISTQVFFFPFVFIGFGVSAALFPFHTWSPDGHSAAPTAVSMFAAGVLMKLGAYGCYRVGIFLLPEGAQAWSSFFIILSAIGVVYGAFGAIWQKDLKYINAYSSISHCGLILFALMMLNETATTGAFLQMISHGLMTALFFAVIGMIYSRTHTRMINEMGGLMKVVPLLSVMYVIAGLASLGLPGLSGFVAEMTVFFGSFQHADVFHRVATIVVASSIVITAVYMLRVIGILFYGKLNTNQQELSDARWFEKVSGYVLIFSVALLGLAPLWLYNLIQDSIATFFENFKM